MNCCRDADGLDECFEDHVYLKVLWLRIFEEFAMLFVKSQSVLVFRSAHILYLPVEHELQKCWNCNSIIQYHLLFRTSAYTYTWKTASASIVLHLVLRKAVKWVWMSFRSCIQSFQRRLRKSINMLCARSSKYSKCGLASSVILAIPHKWESWWTPDPCRSAVLLRIQSEYQRPGKVYLISYYPLDCEICASLMTWRSWSGACKITVVSLSIADVLSGNRTERLFRKDMDSHNSTAIHKSTWFGHFTPKEIPLTSLNDLSLSSFSVTAAAASITAITFAVRDKGSMLRNSPWIRSEIRRFSTNTKILILKTRAGSVTCLAGVPVWRFLAPCLSCVTQLLIPRRISVLWPPRSLFLWADAVRLTADSPLDSKRECNSIVL